MSRGDAPPVTLRRIRTEDWRELRELRLRALTSDPLAFSSTADDERSFSEARWQERATQGAASSDTCTWVAVSATGRLVGMLVGADVDGKPNLFGMWVDPTLRGQGIGGALLDLAIVWARAVHPRADVRLEVNPSQVAAVRLYTSRGFEFTGAKRPPRVPGRAGVVEVVEMVLTASPEGA